MDLACYNLPVPKQIIFVRHGHTANNSLDPKLNTFMGWDDYAGLSDQGRIDAQKTAVKLKDMHIDAVYHSDLIRTTETATIITKELGLISTPTKYLRERNLGNFADLTAYHIKTTRPSDWAKFFDHADADWNGLRGESLRDVSNRFDAFMREISVKHQGDSLLFITHSGIIHTVLRDYFGFFPIESFIEVGHSSVTVLEKSGKKYKLVAHNS